MRLTTELRAAGANLAVEATGVEIARALAAADARYIVLKGPPLSRWLNDPLRTSEDVDFLVPRQDAPAAHDVLLRLGFRQLLAGDRTTTHATTWRRGMQPIAVDLHTQVVGVSAPADDLWAALDAGAEDDALAEHAIRVPGVAGRLALLALHAAQHGVDLAGPIIDLEKALHIASRRDWEDALAFAQRVDAVPAFSAGLTLVNGGRALLEALEVPRVASASVALRAGTPPHTALGIERFFAAHGVLPRLRVLFEELSAPPGFMRDWHPLAARRGGLPLAYLYRPFWLAYHAVPGYLAWRRARRAARL